MNDSHIIDKYELEFLKMALTVIRRFLKSTKENDCPVHQWMCCIFANSIINVFEELAEKEEGIIEKDEASFTIYKNITEAAERFADATFRINEREMH